MPIPAAVKPLVGVAQLVELEAGAPVTEQVGAGSIPATNTALHPTRPAVRIRYAGNIG